MNMETTKKVGPVQALKGGLKREESMGNAFRERLGKQPYDLRVFYNTQKDRTVSYHYIYLYLQIGVI
jgi:hypothetical protein